MSEGREPGMRWVIRLAGLILGAVLGVQVAGVLQPSPVPIGPLRVPVFAAGIVVGGLLGALLSVWVWHRFERAMAWVLARLAHVSLRDLALGVVGLGVGLVLAFLIGVPLSRIPGVGTYLALGAAIALGYLGYHLVMQRRDELAAPLMRLDRSGRGGTKGRGTPKVLDTSVIIDGRVVDVVKAGFLEGPLLVSRSVLAELQRIADSSDTLRRNRGRRGLDVLHRLQQELQAVQVVDDPKDGGGDVDGTLVTLAKSVRGWIVTNDFNLNKVAELQGVCGGRRGSHAPACSTSGRVVARGRPHGRSRRCLRRRPGAHAADATRRAQRDGRRPGGRAPAGLGVCGALPPRGGACRGRT